MNEKFLISLGKPDVHFIDSGSLNYNIEKRIKDLGIEVLKCSLAGVASKEALLAAVASAMKFPGYFGRNWDAFDECLSDMEWLNAKGWVLFIENADECWIGIPRDVIKFVGIWLEVAKNWKDEGKVLSLIFVL